MNEEEHNNEEEITFFEDHPWLVIEPDDEISYSLDEIRLNYSDPL